jgi:hypothetical protein
MGGVNERTSFFDRIPAPVVFVLVAGSGFLAGRAYSADRIIRVTGSAHVGITAALAVIVLVVYFSIRKRFSGAANVCLWLAGCCAGVIRLSLL